MATSSAFGDHVDEHRSGGGQAGADSRIDILRSSSRMPVRPIASATRGSRVRDSRSADGADLADAA